MAERTKGRMIRKGVSSSHRIASLSKDAAVLFFMLIPHFNAHGKMNGNAHFIKGEVAPLVDYLDVKTIEKCLKEIDQKTNVKWFEVGSLRYLQSLNWTEHQDLREARMGIDELPDFKGNGATSEVTPKKSRTSPGHVHPEVEVEGEVEGKGEVEGEDKGNSGGVPVEVILTDLNEKSGKHYRATRDTKALITARWKEGFRLQDFKNVHENMATKWRHDSKMNQYLRPSTLYSASKFEGYINAKPTLYDQGICSEKTEKGLKVFEKFIVGGNDA